MMERETTTDFCLDILSDPTYSCVEPTGSSYSSSVMSENNPTSPVSPLAVYPPHPPTEVRSRAPEFYGFVAWSSTYLLYCFFLFWALLPDTYLIRLGISWYPSRQVSIVSSISARSNTYRYFSVSPCIVLPRPPSCVILAHQRMGTASPSIHHRPRPSHLLCVFSARIGWYTKFLRR